MRQLISVVVWLSDCEKEEEARIIKWQNILDNPIAGSKLKRIAKRELKKSGFYGRKNTN